MKLRLPNKLVAAIMAAASPVLLQTLSTVTVGVVAVAVVGQRVMAEETAVVYKSNYIGRGTGYNVTFSKQAGSSTGPGTGQDSYTNVGINLSNDFTAGNLLITFSGTANATQSISTIGDNGGYGGRVKFVDDTAGNHHLLFNGGIEADAANIDKATNTWEFDNASFFTNETSYADIVVRDGGVRMNGGSGTNYTLNGDISGTGDFFMCTGNDSHSQTFLGSLADYTGTIYGNDAGKQRKLIFGNGQSPATNIGGSIGKSDAVFREIEFNYTSTDDLSVAGDLYASTLTITSLRSLTVGGVLNAAAIANTATASLSFEDDATFVLYNTDAHKSLLSSATGAGNVTMGSSVVLGSAITTQVTGTLTVNKVRTGNTDYDLYIGQDNGTKDVGYDFSTFSKVVLGDDSVVKYHAAGSVLHNVSLEGDASILIRDMKQDTTLNLADTTDLGSHTLTIGATTNDSWKRSVSIDSPKGDVDSKLVFAGGVTSDRLGSKLAINTLQLFAGTLELKEQHTGNPLTATIKTGTAGAAHLKALNFTGTGESAVIYVQNDLVVDSVSVASSSQIRQDDTNGGTITIKKLLGGGADKVLELDAHRARNSKAFTFIVGDTTETYTDENLFSGTLFVTVSDENQGSGSGVSRAVNLQVQAQDVLKNTVVKLQNWGSAYNNSRELMSLMTDVKVAGISGEQTESGADAHGAYIRSGALKVNDPKSWEDMASVGESRTLEITGSGSYTSNARIMDKVNLLMSGSGTQTFSGDMRSFSGNLTVTGGALEFTNASAFNFGDVNVKNGKLCMAQVAADKVVAATVGNNATIEIGSINSNTGSHWSDKNLIQLTKETEETDMSTVKVIAGGTVAYNTNQQNDAEHSTNLNGATLVLKDASKLYLRNTSTGSGYQAGGNVSTGASSVQLQGTTDLFVYGFITDAQTTITDAFTKAEDATVDAKLNIAGDNDKVKFNMSGNITLDELNVSSATTVMSGNTVTVGTLTVKPTGKVELGESATADIGGKVHVERKTANAELVGITANATGIVKSQDATAATISHANVTVGNTPAAENLLALADAVSYNISDVALVDTNVTSQEQLTVSNVSLDASSSISAVAGSTLADNNRLTLGGTGGGVMQDAVLQSNQLSGLMLTTGSNLTIDLSAHGYAAGATDKSVFTIELSDFSWQDLVSESVDAATYEENKGHSLNDVFKVLALGSTDSYFNVISVAQGVTDGSGITLTLEVPEPTTATLSLLALAGLAARRRRK